MQDADPVGAFSGGRARSSVLSVRPSASDWLRCRVPGPRCQIAGTRYLVPGTGHQAECPSHASKNPHTGYARYRMHDAGYKIQDADPACALGLVLGAQYPAFGHGGMRGEGNATFPRPSSRLGTESRTPNPIPGTWHPEPDTQYRIDAGGRDRLLRSPGQAFLDPGPDLGGVDPLALQALHDGTHHTPEVSRAAGSRLTDDLLDNGEDLFST
jgi:hypothetical protein